MNYTAYSYLNEAVNIARNHRVVSFAVGVGQYNVNELKLIAGTDKRVVTVSTFTELQQIVQQMQRGIQSIEGNSGHNCLSFRD